MNYPESFPSSQFTERLPLNMWATLAAAKQTVDLSYIARHAENVAMVVESVPPKLSGSARVAASSVLLIEPVPALG